jgi:son of sevenless-like protein
MESGLLLLKLIQRYYIEPPKECTTDQLEKFNRSKEVIRVRTINVIKKWMELQYSDFEDDARMTQLFEGFMQKLNNAGGTESIWAENLKNFRNGIVDEKARPYQHNTTPPKPLLPTNLIPRLIRFLDLHPTEVARQITRIDFETFQKIKPKEYFHKAWMKSNKEKAPNVLIIVQNFNKVCN